MRGSKAAGADDGVVANLRDRSFKSFSGKGVYSYFCRLAYLHVDDIGFIHVDFSGDDSHISDGHQGAARRVLDAHNHGLTFAHRQVGNHAIKGRNISGLAEHITGAGEAGAGLADVSLR